MALQKAIQTAFGIDVSYWKICSIKADYWSNTMVANMNAWPSMQERMTGNAPIATREFIWTNVDFPAEESASSNTTRSIIYGLIKKYRIEVDEGVFIMEFADAVDC